MRISLIAAIGIFAHEMFLVSFFVFSFSYFTQ